MGDVPGPSEVSEPLLPEESNPGYHSDPPVASMTRDADEIALVRDASLLSSQEVVKQVLDPMGLGEHASVFLKHKITGRVLQMLTDDDLRDLLPVVGDRVRLSHALSSLRNSARSVQRNRPILSWSNVRTIGAVIYDFFTCSSPTKFKLTSSYLEIKHNTCGRINREVVDLSEIEDVHEDGQCCCLECLPCPCFGCGLHSVHVCLHEDNGKKNEIMTVVEKKHALELFNTVRNAWEMHHNQIRMDKQ
mmetsp:Transcript_5225/g.9947  ORF Transcript_5225/g.9947 Transcript_5225/m.9947 type:complete len:247 (-) Transcript_5225:354-1094(-)|eukprot:CAMPEP_0114232934 /NCGR_PEP_ID=MMETSP0058-20121206/4882_1 /TAXON_ID=36894 /ORGANISM="Pyramimonas parkeae, CCMP726" /LENGTH=246 /DNA_ID=CAMNT_0001344463 /DNA_START=90 /DNA_END=830 /DNA_ORIENTATION=-